MVKIILIRVTQIYLMQQNKQLPKL